MTIAVKPGIGHVGSFQVSGYPYVTGSTNLDDGVEQKIDFPRVVKSITVINRAAPEIRVHFNSKSSGNVYTGGHYISLPVSGDAVTFNIKCKEIYVSNASGTDNASYELFAEVTSIESAEMPTLTGSGLTE
jgi:hypothetical protein